MGSEEDRSEVLRVKAPAMAPEFFTSFKAKHSGDEALCFDRLPQLPDQPALRTEKFCKVFEVDPRLGCVIGPRASAITSPAKAFVDKPAFNCGFALDSVFRIMRVNSDFSVEFSTGWVVSPPTLGEDGRYMFYAVCSAHALDKPQDAEYYKGSFGQAARPKDFRYSAFHIEKYPVLCVKEEGADIAIIRCFFDGESKDRIMPRNVSFLLPCSPAEYGAEGAHLATFGYNGFPELLQQAKRELLEDASPELFLWDLYGDMFDSKLRLYDAMCATVDFEAGGLCCSPTAVVQLEGNYAKLRSSTAKGCSGAPVMPSRDEGVVCYTHTGRQPSTKGYDIMNRGTGLDLQQFVDCYREHIVKLIPKKLEGRSTLPFRKWCDLHDITCPVLS